jgi:hypothetical protein
MLVFFSTLLPSSPTRRVNVAAGDRCQSRGPHRGESRARDKSGRRSLDLCPTPLATSTARQKGNPTQMVYVLCVCALGKKGKRPTKPR